MRFITMASLFGCVSAFRHRSQGSRSFSGVSSSASTPDTGCQGAVQFHSELDHTYDNCGGHFETEMNNLTGADSYKAQPPSGQWFMVDQARRRRHRWYCSNTPELHDCGGGNCMKVDHSSRRRFKITCGSCTCHTPQQPVRSARLDSSPCVEAGAATMDLESPISAPLLCEGQATNVRFTVKASGWRSGMLELRVDGVAQQGSSEWRDGFLSETVWTYSVNDLSAGTHSVQLFDRREVVDLYIFARDAILENDGGLCTFSTPSRARDWSEYTYSGFDTMYPLFGEAQPFPAWQKDHLYFASESVGKPRGGGIDASIISEGWYRWIFEFSQDSPPNDRWGHRGVLWNESLITPYPEAHLAPLAGRSGQTMVVQEPCNALSSYSYHQAAVWITCKGYPFEEDELASLVSAFNSLAAGTIFQHACACDTGGRADSFTMDWLVLQIHQTAVRQVIGLANAHLTETEKAAILTFNTGIGEVTDLARNMTQLFSEKYNHSHWNATMRAVDIPGYMIPIAGFISFVFWSIQDKIAPGAHDLLEAALNALIDAFDVPQKDFFVNTYNPAVRKALSFANICSDAVLPVLDSTVRFVLTFVEALIYQEQTLEVPEAISDVLAILDSLGVTHDLYADMADTWSYYNGFDCLGRSDHAIWHEKAAHGLVHFLNVAQYYRSSVGC